MITRDLLKSEIDQLPDAALKEVQAYLQFLKTIRPAEKRKRPSFKLNGQFDEVHIRQQAYDDK